MATGVIYATFKPEDGKRLPCREGEDRTEYHERSTGLRLRVSRSGARTWLVVFWSPIAKTARRLKLGDGAVMPLKKARAAARTALHAIEKEGRDPYAERLARREQEREARKRRSEERRQAAEQRSRATFGKLISSYIEHRRTTPGKFKRPARPTTLRNWKGMLPKYILPKIGNLRPENIGAEDFLHVLEYAVKEGGPSMGPRVRELLCAAWRWMEQRIRVLGVRLPAVSPLVGLEKIGTESKERERVLTPLEVWRFWKATEDEGLLGEALRLSLLTAARVKEATELPWSEIDLPAKVWKLPANRNKGGRDRTIPLSEPALMLLRRVQGQSNSERVFGARSYLSEVMKRVQVRMGGEHWEPRDLRRTSATLCARLGADPFVVSLVLGHAQPDECMPAVTKTYLRWNYEDKVREALHRLGAWVEDTVTRTAEPATGTVAALRRP